MQGNNGCFMQPYISFAFAWHCFDSFSISTIVFAPFSVSFIDHSFDVSYHFSDGHLHQTQENLAFAA